MRFPNGLEVSSQVTLLMGIHCYQRIASHPKSNNSYPRMETVSVIVIEEDRHVLILRGDGASHYCACLGQALLLSVILSRPKKSFASAELSGEHPFI